MANDWDGAEKGRKNHQDISSEETLIKETAEQARRGNGEANRANRKSLYYPGIGLAAVILGLGLLTEIFFPIPRHFFEPSPPPSRTSSPQEPVLASTSSPLSLEEKINERLRGDVFSTHIAVFRSDVETLLQNKQEANRSTLIKQKYDALLKTIANAYPNPNNLNASQIDTLVILQALVETIQYHFSQQPAPTSSLIVNIDGLIQRDLPESLVDEARWLKAELLRMSERYTDAQALYEQLSQSTREVMVINLFTGQQETLSTLAPARVSMMKQEIVATRLKERKGSIRIFLVNASSNNRNNPKDKRHVEEAKVLLVKNGFNEDNIITQNEYGRSYALRVYSYYKHDEDKNILDEILGIVSPTTKVEQIVKTKLEHLLMKSWVRTLFTQGQADIVVRIP